MAEARPPQLLGMLIVVAALALYVCWRVFRVGG